MLACMCLVPITLMLLYCCMGGGPGGLACQLGLAASSLSLCATAVCMGWFRDSAEQAAAAAALLQDGDEATLTP